MDTIDKTPQTRLIKKGAEASLFLTEWHNRKAIIKVRIPKRTDPKLWTSKSAVTARSMSPSLMHEAKAAGVATPLDLHGKRAGINDYHGIH